ncbi:MAG: MBL fold metallo-hydrolase [Lachnospiraceae bacterium]|nr:MBL fold metallo-hydrolase [Lachnospiraceae bacterium]
MHKEKCEADARMRTQDRLPADKGRKKKRLIKIRFALTVLAGLLLLCGIFALRQFGPGLVRQYRQQQRLTELPDGSTLEVIFLDVGQADATLLFCDGMTMLIDTGYWENVDILLDYLDAYQVETIDYLVLTHADSDHIGGAADVLASYEVEEVFFSDFEKDNPSYTGLIGALQEEGLTAWLPDPGYGIAFGGATVTFLGPVGEWDTPNNTSICLRIDHGVNSFLFTGDAQQEAEEALLASGQELSATVYKVGHHGSYTSSTEAFLNAVQPQYAVISCGTGNDYGHPHTSALKHLEAVGAEIYRTDLQGTLTFVSDGSTLTVPEGS